MEINLGKIPFDIDFHPSEPLVTAGLISGYLLLYRLNDDSTTERLFKIRAHRKSCRAVRFTNDGRALVTGSADSSIIVMDAETGKVLAHLDNAHSSAVNRIKNLSEGVIASGDDNGCVKVWDTRQQSCSNSFCAHKEYISDMAFTSDGVTLLATSGDGTLSVCDLRRNKITATSEFSEDELLSIVIMKNGKKVICGAQSGTLLLYSWGYFKDCSDRFVKLSPNSIDALLKLDEDRVITGTENGIISLVGILPNRVIQPIAEHSEYPIERLALTHDKKFLGSISHDPVLKLWDLHDLLPSLESKHASQLASGNSKDEMDVDDIFVESINGSKGRTATDDFFADL